RGGQHDVDHIAGTNHRAGFGGAVVDAHAAQFDQLSDFAAADALKAVLQVTVHPFAYIADDLKPPMLGAVLFKERLLIGLQFAFNVGLVDHGYGAAGSSAGSVLGM